MADDLKIEIHRVDRRKGISSVYSEHGDGKKPGLPSKYVKTQKNLQHVNINKQIPFLSRHATKFISVLTPFYTPAFTSVHGYISWATM